MYKTSLIMALILAAFASHAQPQGLQVTNDSDYPLNVQCAVANVSNCEFGGATSTVVIPVGGSYTFPPVNSLQTGNNWAGIEAFPTAAPIRIRGVFYTPCLACGTDRSTNLNIRWNVSNGCYSATLY